MSDSSPVPQLDADVLHPPLARRVRALDGNRAALLLLLSQNVVSAVLVRLGLPLGLSLVLTFVITVLLALVLLRPGLSALVQDSRWRTPPAWGTALLALLLALIASRGVLIFVISIWPQGAQNIQQFQSAGSDLWLLLLAGGVLIPFAEEIAFRGLLMRGYEWARGPLYAALAASAIFGLAHGVPAQIVAILPIAWVLARADQHTGSLWTGVIIHALNNSLALGLGAFLSGNGELSKLLDTDQMPQLPVQVGLAGLLVGLAALFVATVWLQPRRELGTGAGGPLLSGSLIVLVLLIAVIVVAASGLVPLGGLGSPA
ncbi:type II CAAX endopeptidase family protein [Deinococcus sonorensis]|uniref:Type II CAAX endopeptidase family protein n=2 Tax=Deinococcus sonorensis TaxID=309891 RepID=A0AAU7U8L2_9DEIO